MSRWVQILGNSLKGHNARVVIDKIRSRTDGNQRNEAISWARKEAISVEQWCSARNSENWENASEHAKRLNTECSALLDTVPSQFRWGGAVDLLSFLVRDVRPEVTVETGVAAGWSSRAILEALLDIPGGRLYSSDFPYLRMKRPEQYIGFLVPETLRSDWYLDIRGDVIAIPKIVSMIDRIDLFHYDSDKSYRGRARTMEQVEPLFGDGTIVVMDDIDDNMFFKEWVESRNLSYAVLTTHSWRFIGIAEYGSRRSSYGSD